MAAIPPPQEYGDLISTLPLEERWAPVRIRKYQGCWIPEFALPCIMAMEQSFKARPDDIFVLSYPKSGTTWLKALAFAIMTRTQHSLSDHPLLSLNPHDCVPFMDRVYSPGQASEIEAMPSPRILNTHLPYSLLPDSIKKVDCRLIYVCRDPKDVLVSRWYFSNRMRSEMAELTLLPFSEAFELFCEGVCPYGLLWDHVLGYWEESLRRPEKVLFLKYEEMLEDPLGTAKRLAELMGCPFSAEEEKEGVVQEIVGLCSFEKLKSLEVNTTGKLHPNFSMTNDAFFRKGKAGDWRSHMSTEMAARFDGVAQRKKLQGSGLAFGNACLKTASMSSD